jgi:hypothetical protein
MGIELSPFVRELEFGIWNLPLLFGTWHLAPGTTNGACRYEEYDNVRVKLICVYIYIYIYIYIYMKNMTMRG